MGIYATFTSRHKWICDDCVAIDDALVDSGYALIDMDWSTFDLLPDDPDHFTWDGFCTFSRALATCCHALGHASKRILILSDSTIDHWNYNDDGEWTGWANVQLTDTMRNTGIEVCVDAVCGSGFVAMPDFGSRITKRPRDEKFDSIVVIGGWNDTCHEMATVLRVIRSRHSTFSRRLTQPLKLVQQRLGPPS